MTKWCWLVTDAQCAVSIAVETILCDHFGAGHSQFPSEIWGSESKGWCVQEKLCNKLLNTLTKKGFYLRQLDSCLTKEFLLWTSACDGKKVPVFMVHHPVRSSVFVASRVGSSGRRQDFVSCAADLDASVKQASVNNYLNPACVAIIAHHLFGDDLKKTTEVLRGRDNIWVEVSEMDFDDALDSARESLEAYTNQARRESQKTIKPGAHELLNLQ